MKSLIQHPVTFVIITGLSLSVFAVNDVIAKDSESNITAIEQQEKRPVFEEIDTDKDSTISIQEAKTNAWLNRNFVTIDSNKDGIITPTEFSVAVQDNA